MIKRIIEWKIPYTPDIEDCIVGALILLTLLFIIGEINIIFFPFNMSEAQMNHVRDDIDVILSAIKLHDAQNRPLVGSEFPYHGHRYNQQPPADPWGNQYNLDANIGLIICFGADAQGSGAGIDTDIFKYYRPELSIKRIQYDGLWGIPQKDNKLMIKMNKAFAVKDVEIVKDTLHLLTDLTQQDVPNARKGTPVSFREMNLRGKVSPDWQVRKAPGEDNYPNYYRLPDTILVLHNTVNAKGENVQHITPTMAINFDVTITPTALGAEYGIIETSVEGGPLTTAIYGSEIIRYYRAPVSVPLYNGENRGIRIEKF